MRLDQWFVLCDQSWIATKMAAPGPMYNGLPDVELMTLIGSLETGKVVTIFFAKKRPERRTLEIKPLSGQLVWIKAQGVRPEGSSKYKRKLIN